jgi:hypothetical protein
MPHFEFGDLAVDVVHIGPCLLQGRTEVTPVHSDQGVALVDASAVAHVNPIDDAASGRGGLQLLGRVDATV